MHVSLSSARAVVTIPLPPDAPPLDDWHPKVRRLFVYWHSLRPAPDVLPGRQHFDPLAIVDIMPWVWMLDREEGPPERLRYRLLGTRMVEAMRRDLTGQRYDEAHFGVMEHPMFHWFR